MSVKYICKQCGQKHESERSCTPFICGQCGAVLYDEHQVLRFPDEIDPATKAVLEKLDRIIELLDFKDARPTAQQLDALAQRERWITDMGLNEEELFILQRLKEAVDGELWTLGGYTRLIRLRLIEKIDAAERSEACLIEGHEAYRISALGKELVD